jgi:hypothetical protein
LLLLYCCCCCCILSFFLCIFFLLLVSCRSIFVFDGTTYGRCLLPSLAAATPPQWLCKSCCIYMHIARTLV